MQWIGGCNLIKNIAHRGFKGKYPENTLLSFKKAIEVGSDGIEFDVQFTKDKEVVIIHDETLDRTTDGNGFVKDYTLKELKKLNASKCFEKEFGFNAIPTLEEYFIMVGNEDIISNIELKNSIFSYEGMEKTVCDLISKYNMERKVIISSFNHHSIMKVKEINKNIECGLLVGSWIINPGEYVKNLGIENFHPAAYGLTKDEVSKIQSFGIKVNAWLGSIDVDFSDLIATGVDSIISDNPDVIKELI
jgi:glycerophosphoryl diester phosphodiesterase